MIEGIKVAIQELDERALRARALRNTRIIGSRQDDH